MLFGAGVLPGRFPVWICRSCWAARMASSMFCLLVCVCVQDKRAALKKFRESVSSVTNPSGYEAAACAVTVSKAAWLTACLNLEDPVAAREYCHGLRLVVMYAGASGCDVIMSAGCIPLIVECLRRWPADGPYGVVWAACLALNNLASKGSASVRTAIKSVPGIQATLVAAKKSRLDGDMGWAALALEKLGFNQGCVIQ